MKALKKYMKKTGSDDPFGKTKPLGKMENVTEKSDQYATTSGRKVVDDSTSEAETAPDKYGAYESIRDVGKKKKRSYLDD